MEELGNGLVSLPGHVAINGIRCSLLAIEKVIQQTTSVFIRDIIDRSREAFSLCILPSVTMEIWPLPSESIQTGAANIIPLYPADIDSLAAEKISIYDLLVYKLYRRLILDKPDAATQYDARLTDGFVSYVEAICYFDSIDCGFNGIAPSFQKSYRS